MMETKAIKQAMCEEAQNLRQANDRIKELEKELNELKNELAIVKRNNERKDIWFRAWCVVAADCNVPTKNIPSAWADDALKAYDERFGDE
jgi:hypothetical protein